MAQTLPTVPKEDIIELYTSVTTGTYAQDIQQIQQFVNGDETEENPSLDTKLADLTDIINQLSGDTDSSLTTQIQNYNNLINELDITLTQIEANLQIWRNKRGIMTTVTNGQPNFTGIYSNLSNEDFANGSVCFCLIEN